MVLCLIPPEVQLFGAAALCMGLITIVGAVFSGFSQELDDPPVQFGRKIKLHISNSLDISRHQEPVIIPVQSILKKAPDFNRKFFRVKHPATRFEPLDIPSQIRSVPGTVVGGEELVFQVDLDPHERKTVELQYNPEGNDLPDYPIRTRSFESWYRDGSNSAWENEIIAYRYYYGMVDYFGKSYPVLSLDGLRSDSYHHERLWGQDPYAVGKTPGLGGISLVRGDNIVKCYGYPDDAPSNTYEYRAFGGGPVCAGVVLRTVDKTTGDFLIEAATSLYHGRYENHVTAAPSTAHSDKGWFVAPGMKKFDDEHVTVDEDGGFMFAWGIPVGEYGTIGTAFIWNPLQSGGIHETTDARLVKLEPSDNGTVSYCTLAVWYRASAEQPADQDAFSAMVGNLAFGFSKPVMVEIDV
ncbi:DUF4861 domain-containing protein [bacterium]|nr:DUF4861 domain-containing protein [bacterium]